MATDKPPKLLIVAGSFMQANRYASKKKMDPDDWIYVQSPQDIMGCPRRSEFVLVGTFIGNRNWGVISETLKSRECVDVTE